MSFLDRLFRPPAKVSDIMQDTWGGDCQHHLHRENITAPIEGSKTGCSASYTVFSCCKCDRVWDESKGDRMPPPPPPSRPYPSRSLRV